MLGAQKSSPEPLGARVRARPSVPMAVAISCWRLVPGRRQAGGIGEDGGRAVGQAVQGFVPPAIGRDAQARNGGRVHAHERDLFFQGEPRHQIIHPFLQRQLGIVERRAEDPDVGVAACARPERRACRRAPQRHSRPVHYQAGPGCRSSVGGGARRRICCRPRVAAGLTPEQAAWTSHPR